MMNFLINASIKLMIWIISFTYTDSAWIHAAIMKILESSAICIMILLNITAFLNFPAKIWSMLQHVRIIHLCWKISQLLKNILLQNVILSTSFSNCNSAVIFLQWTTMHCKNIWLSSFKISNLFFRFFQALSWNWTT